MGKETETTERGKVQAKGVDAYLDGRYAVMDGYEMLVKRREREEYSKISGYEHIVIYEAYWVSAN